MKQKLMLFSLALLFIVSGCKKETPTDETTASGDLLQEKTLAPESKEGQCRLIASEP